MTRVLQYNFSSSNVPGAYYGLLPELPHVQLSTPNGSIDYRYNYTGADLSNDGNATRWDFLYTIYFNRPDSESVYASPSGYQYSQVSHVRNSTNSTCCGNGTRFRLLNLLYPFIRPSSMDMLRPVLRHSRRSRRRVVRGTTMTPFIYSLPETALSPN